MWIAGVMQGLMWRAVNPDGTLVYSFVESVKATYPFYVIRFGGGVLYLGGMLIMGWNVVMTVMNSKAVEARIPQAVGQAVGATVGQTVDPTVGPAAGQAAPA